MIGYSIGYGILHDPDDASRLFSIWHNLCGCLMINGYVATILRWSLDKKPDWRILARNMSSNYDVKYSDPDLFSNSLMVTLKQILENFKIMLMRTIYSNDRHFIVFSLYILFGVIWTYR